MSSIELFLMIAALVLAAYTTYLVIVDAVFRVANLIMLAGLALLAFSWSLPPPYELLANATALLIQSISLAITTRINYVAARENYARICGGDQ